MSGYWTFLLLSFPALAQSSEGRVERYGDRAILTVESGRPLDSAAMTLAEKFGIAVSVEDPPYVYRDDVKDISAQVSRAPNPARRVFVPQGGTIRVEFATDSDGAPQNLRVLLQSLVDDENRKFPFGYRLDESGGAFTLIPTHTRDIFGRLIEVTPLLDRRVSISLGIRTIRDAAQMMADELSAQTGLHVSCCQATISGIPWGMKSISFSAHDERARDVLRRLIAEELDGRQNVFYWLERCDPSPSPWCFINLFNTSPPRPEPPRVGSQPPSAGQRLGKSSWFDAAPDVPPSSH